MFKRITLDVNSILKDMEFQKCRYCGDEWTLPSYTYINKMGDKIDSDRCPACRGYTKRQIDSPEIKAMVNEKNFHKRKELFLKSKTLQCTRCKAMDNALYVWDSEQICSACNALQLEKMFQAKIDLNRKRNVLTDYKQKQYNQ